MTLITQHPISSTDNENALKIRYQVAMPHPENHLFEVVLQLNGYKLSILDLKMPVWTPGSYLVREYAKNLQDFGVFAASQALPWRKVSKNHWQIDTAGVSKLTIKYRVYANELSVRTNHLDTTHGYFNGAALFFRIVGFDKQSITINITPPHPEWIVTSALNKLEGQLNTFIADDFDILVDSPFEVGTQELYKFDVLGKSHELAIWGKGNYQAEEMIADFQKIIEVEAGMFGGLPYDRYVFLLHLFSQSYGGLEHKNSCSLVYQRFGFRERDKYERFMQLVAHEFFHLWNVKRIRPKGLEIFDYEQENYTPSLWFCEGTTSYYDLLIPLRAGIYNAKKFLFNCSKEITRYLTTPGRRVQPLAESSFDAWIKLYRQDANSPNSQISYYLKGEMVSLLLDLLIRTNHRNERSLDDVMLKMWEQFGKQEIGYTPEELEEVIQSVADTDLFEFFERYLHTTEDLPFNDYLEAFGLKLVADGIEEPYFGVRVVTENGREIIKFVEYDSPAQQAGIDATDELLAIDGIKLTSGALSDRLKDYQPGDTLQVTVFHQDKLCIYPVILQEGKPTKYLIKAVDNPTPLQEEKFAGWLGEPLVNIK
jgi:predicted metalloprotease with PDZ domain